MLTDLTLGPPNVAHRAATRAVAGIVEAAAARRQGDTVQQFVIRWGEDFLTKLPMRKPLNLSQWEKVTWASLRSSHPDFHKFSWEQQLFFFVESLCGIFKRSVPAFHCHSQSCGFPLAPESHRPSSVKVPGPAEGPRKTSDTTSTVSQTSDGTRLSLSTGDHLGDHQCHSTLGNA